MFRVFLVILCLVWNTSSLTRRAELSKDEEPPDGRSLGSYQSTRSRRNHRPSALYGCGTPAGGAQELRHQNKTRRGEVVGVTRSEQKLRGTCQRAGNIISTVDSAMRGALVRQVSSAEEMAQSAVRKAPVCKDPSAAQVRGLREQSKSRRRG